MKNGDNNNNRKYEIIANAAITIVAIIGSIINPDLCFIMLALVFLGWQGKGDLK